MVTSTPLRAASRAASKPLELVPTTRTFLPCIPEIRSLLYDVYGRKTNLPVLRRVVSARVTDSASEGV